MNTVKDENWGADFLGSLVELRRLSIERTNDPAIEFLVFCSAHAVQSNSHIFQDLFVLFILKGKKNGFFVEFGASDGLAVSNTYLLEKQFGWHGILAEPARNWQDALARNRSSKIDRRCVYSETGQNLLFKETENAYYSTLASLASTDMHASHRETGKVYSVETVSLHDLLVCHAAPKNIDYISIDTEGSELAILSAFDFSKFKIDVFTVEHNHTANRSTIANLMNKNGYVNIFPALSDVDDWFVHERVLANW